MHSSAMKHESPSETYIEEIVRRELEVDIGSGDITSTSVLPESAIAEAVLIAKAYGVLAGVNFAAKAFEIVSPKTIFSPRKRDGELISPREVIADVSGRAVDVLSAERTALNFLGHLSGIATITRKFVDAVAGTKAVILDTRKTTPGLRIAEKYAVRCGGGKNHRMGLHDMILIKDNHIAASGGIEDVLKKLYSTGKKPRVPVEVEVTDLQQLSVALTYPLDRIMLDNFSIDAVQSAMELRAEIGANIPFECSGGITLENVRAYAETGVEYISVGAITHSAPQLDLSLEVSIEVR